MAKLESSHGNNKVMDATRKAMNYPIGVQYAITQVLPNIINGAFWGFTSMQDIQKHADAIRSESHIVPRKLGNACLIEVDPDFMLSAVTSIDPNAITQADLGAIKQSMADAVVSFEKFLIRQGKNAKGFTGMIGIYCTNDVTSISYKNVNYPAFRLTMGKALSLLSVYGYGVQVGSNFIPAAQAASQLGALWGSAMLSPTKTGVFINIQYMGSVEQMLSKEKEFKAKYGVAPKGSRRP